MLRLSTEAKRFWYGFGAHTAPFDQELYSICEDEVWPKRVVFVRVFVLLLADVKRTLCNACEVPTVAKNQSDSAGSFFEIF